MPEYSIFARCRCGETPPIANITAEDKEAAEAAALTAVQSYVYDVKECPCGAAGYTIRAELVVQEV